MESDPRSAEAKEVDYAGMIIGNWQLGQLLGQGAFGAVYAANNTTIPGHHAAVKILHPWLALRKEVQERFITEASAASRAAHENIVQVFDGGVSPTGVCYVIMELLRGRSLSDLLQKGPLNLRSVVNVGSQVASALHAAHKIGIVHRDLKPDNLFVTERASNAEFVKVLDFGVAKLQSGSDAALRTKTGALLGTPVYMSPEQWQSRPDIDGRSDIYALGVILFECATGTLPFSANSLFGWMEAHTTHEPRDPASCRPIHPDLRSLLLRMLHKRREDRPQLMADVKQELDRIQANLGSMSVSTVGAVNPTAGAIRGHRVWIAALGTGLLLCGAGLWTRSDHPKLPASAIDMNAPSVLDAAAEVTGRVSPLTLVDLGVAPIPPLEIAVVAPKSIKSGDVIHVQVYCNVEAYIFVLSQSRKDKLEMLRPSHRKKAPHVVPSRPLRFSPLQAVLDGNALVAHEELLVYGFTSRDDADRILRVARQHAPSALDELVRALPPQRAAQRRIRYEIHR